MSRTYKDNKRVRHWNDYWMQDKVPCEYYGYRLTKTTKPKLRKEVDTEDHWMSTPSWWTHLIMIRPQRRAGRVWESAFVNTDIDMWALQEVDAPGVSKRPHQYYW